jgi:predicted nucleotidyltransferase
MTSIIEDCLPEIVALCQRHHVRRLELFGSATGDGFRPAASDLDFLVEFAPLSSADHADSYFGLLHDLEDLFARQVDLLERGPIRNPYLLSSIDESKVVLYEAA